MYTTMKSADRWFVVPIVLSDGRRSRMLMRYDRIVGAESCRAEGVCAVRYDTGTGVELVEVGMPFDSFVEMVCEGRLDSFDSSEHVEGTDFCAKPR